MEPEVSTQTSTPSPDPVYLETGNTSPSHHDRRSGTVIPNRIFVGGIDFKTNENELWRFFSHHGDVLDVKIVTDRAGVSKGYGFVTFDTEEDVQKLLRRADILNIRNKKLSIGPAIRRQHIGGHRDITSLCNVPECPATLHSSTLCHGPGSANSFSVSSPTPGMTIPAPCGTTGYPYTGYPYTFHNGVAYFYSSEMRPPAPAHHWPSVSGSPVMVTQPPQPIYQQPTYHHYQAPAQCIPGHLQWNHPQSPAPSSPVLPWYMQPSELVYQPLEMPPDGGCVQPAVPVQETPIPEPQFIDHMVQPTYHQVYAQSLPAMAPIMQQSLPAMAPIMQQSLPAMAPIMQQEPVKDQKFHFMRQGFPHSSVSLKPRGHHSPHYTHLRNDYMAESSDSSPTSATDPLN